MVLPSAFLARYFQLFFSFSSHLIHITSSWSCCVFYPTIWWYFLFSLWLHFWIKYGRGLYINNICFVSHPFWPYSKYSQHCSDRRNANMYLCSWPNKIFQNLTNCSRGPRIIESQYIGKCQIRGKFINISILTLVRFLGFIVDF